MKNYISFSKLFFALLCAFTVVSCKKDDEPTPDTTPSVGKIEFDIEHIAGDADFEFDKYFINDAGDSLKFTMFKYFLSNISLVKADGSIVTLANGKYPRLINQEEISSLGFSIDSVPVGTYTGLQFTIGVDSLTNTLPVEQRTGDLDVSGKAAGMYWTWNSGYIFMKVEGTSPQIADAGNVFMYHIGGFGGYSSPAINNIKTVQIKLEEGKTFTLAKGGSKELHIMADILELFKSPTSFSVADNSVIMGGEFSKKIAENYTDMFKLDHVH